MCFLLLCSVLNKTGTSQQVPETLRASLSTLHALWMFDVYMPIDCHKCISVTARVCASGVHVSYLCASSSPGLTVPAPCCPGTPWPPGYLVSLKPSVVKISSTCKAPAIGGGEASVASFINSSIKYSPSLVPPLSAVPSTSGPLPSILQLAKKQRRTRRVTSSRLYVVVLKEHLQHVHDSLCLQLCFQDFS